jgi:hypothetical protein
MAGIFISYRRADSISATGRLHEYLVNAFGNENVFKDVEDIPPGVDFRDHLRNSIAACNIVIVMIGNRWVSITDAEGNRRLFQEDDWVRTEVATALSNQDTTVIPVLIEGAQPPQANDLPEDLKELAYRNAFQLRNDPDFPGDAQKLIEFLRPHMGDIPQRKPPEPTKRRRIPGGFILGMLVGVLVLIGLILAIPLPDSSNTPNELTDVVAALSATPSPTPTVTPAPQQVAQDAAETTLYENTAMGYSFLYPSGWEVVEEPEEIGVLAVEGQDFLIFVYDFIEPVESLEELSQYIEFVFPGVAYSDQEEVTVAGLPALQYTWIDPPQYRARSLAIIDNDHGFIFAVEPIGDAPIDETRQEEIFTLLVDSLVFD